MLGKSKESHSDLKLSDYKNIWTKFCFLDESGSLNDQENPFFTVGFIKCSQPYYINSKIIYERTLKNFHDEMKFNKLSRNNINIVVVADYVTTPKDIKFEVNVKRRINEKLKRLTVADVCRFDSKTNDLLQLADLMVGAINYDLKLATGLILRGDKYKRRFLEHFKMNLGIQDKSFIDGFKNYMFNIFVDKDAQQRLPLKGKNEKEPSS